MRRQLGGLGLVFAALMVLSSATTAQKTKYAAPYPRDGVLKLGESDRVVAWELLRARGAVSPMYRPKTSGRSEGRDRVDLRTGGALDR
jgi:hypothetical protein